MAKESQWAQNRGVLTKKNVSSVTGHLPVHASRACLAKQELMPSQTLQTPVTLFSFFCHVLKNVATTRSSTMNKLPTRPTSLTRLAVIQEYQAGVDACEELKIIATDEGARQLAVATREKLMELLDDRLALQGAMDRCPRAYSQICDTERYRRLSQEKLELETVCVLLSPKCAASLVPLAQKLLSQMITKQVKETRRQLWDRKTNSVQNFLETSRPAPLADDNVRRGSSGPPDPSTKIYKSINIQSPERILETQGSCNLMDTRRIHRWLTKVDSTRPSEIPPSPQQEEMSWDCLY